MEAAQVFASRTFANRDHKAEATLDAYPPSAVHGSDGKKVCLISIFNPPQTPNRNME